MNAVATVQETAIATQAPVSLMDALIRAASDPNVDVDKLERLGAIVERINAQQAEQAFNQAMNAAQAEMRPVATDANNSQTSSKYATYAALDHALRVIYTAHGFSLSYGTAEGAPDGQVRVICRVAHSDGHTRVEHLDMPCDGKGAKGGDVMTKTHATGAAMTYGQRYLLKMIFNIAVGEDRDGNAPRKARQMGEAARQAIEDINACDTPAELAFWKKTKSAAAVAASTTADGQEVIATYNRRAAAMKDATHGA